MKTQKIKKQATFTAVKLDAKELTSIKGGASGSKGGFAVGGFSPA